MTLASLQTAIRRGSTAERRQLYLTLRAEFAHHLEKEWGLDAETILDAIARSSDLTQRGIRGVVAESVFIREVLPTALEGTPDWRVVADLAAGDISYDAVVEHAQTRRRVRIQVKNQRRQAGAPKEMRGAWVVEVQKTALAKRMARPPGLTGSPIST